MNNTPKYRWPLNKDQLEVLNLLYKFRFASSNLIAQYFGKSNGSHVYKRLKILQEQDFIGKRYGNNSRIQGKPAAYYLLPNGMGKLNELRVSEGKDSISIARLYKETRVTEGFVEYCMDVLGIYLTLNTLYGDNLRFFTKNQLTNKYDYFSEFTPSVYIRLDTNGTEKDYFLEYFQSSKPFFTITQRLKQYIDYADSGEWEAATNSDFPKVLLVCDKPSLQNRLRKRTASVLDDARDDLQFFVTTKGSSTWFNLAESDGVLSSSPI